jgi:CitMHS family citrate-Mg2+:H+ or citrate-Ca2+:H+ symporter
MLTLLGVATIVALLVLILFRITSALVALILVPIVAAIVGGFGSQVGSFAMDGIRSVVPVASLFAFAVLYFGVMNDAGLFDPIIRGLVGLVGTDPVKIAVGTAAVATISHLDGAGASAFMITIPAMLPLYTRVRMDPLALTSITALAAGTTNMLPWAGPTTRAASALHVSTSDLFVPILPAMVVGVGGVFAISALIGRKERHRISSLKPLAELEGPVSSGSGAKTAEGARPVGALWFFNAALTIVAITGLFIEVLPPSIVFIIAAALALIVNYPDVNVQRDRITAHGGAAMMMVVTIFAAGVFTGILTHSGVLGALSADVARMLPQSALRHLPVGMAAASMPLSLAFDPDSFYFGLLPVLANASQAVGGSSVEVGRAALLGQMTTGFPVSPLTPSTFLLVGLASVDLADHQRRTIAYAFGITLLMTVAAIVLGAIGL